MERSSEFSDFGFNAPSDNVVDSNLGNESFDLIRGSEYWDFLSDDFFDENNGLNMGFELSNGTRVLEIATQELPSATQVMAISTQELFVDRTGKQEVQQSEINVQSHGIQPPNRKPLPLATVDANQLSKFKLYSYCILNSTRSLPVAILWFHSYSRASKFVVLLLPTVSWCCNFVEF